MHNDLYGGKTLREILKAKKIRVNSYPTSVCGSPSQPPATLSVSERRRKIFSDEFALEGNTSKPANQQTGKPASIRLNEDVDETDSPPPLADID